MEKRSACYKVDCLTSVCLEGKSITRPELKFNCWFVQVGQGTYSNVYKARDRDTKKIVALKRSALTHQSLKVSSLWRGR